MFQLATSYLTLTDAVNSFLFLKQPCQKTYAVFVEKMSLFQNCSVFGLHQPLLSEAYQEEMLQFAFYVPNKAH